MTKLAAKTFVSPWHACRIKLCLPVNSDVSTALSGCHSQQLQPGPDVFALLMQALRLRTLGSNRMM